VLTASPFAHVPYFAFFHHHCSRASSHCSLTASSPDSAPLELSHAVSDFVAAASCTRAALQLSSVAVAAFTPAGASQTVSGYPVTGEALSRDNQRAICVLRPTCTLSTSAQASATVLYSSSSYLVAVALKQPTNESAVHATTKTEPQRLSETGISGEEVSSR
jgi:hypothetical protein